MPKGSFLSIFSTLSCISTRPCTPTIFFKSELQLTKHGINVFSKNSFEVIFYSSHFPFITTIFNIFFTSSGPQPPLLPLVTGLLLLKSGQVKFLQNWKYMACRPFVCFNLGKTTYCPHLKKGGTRFPFQYIPPVALSLFLLSSQPEKGYDHDQENGLVWEVMWYCRRDRSE